VKVAQQIHGAFPLHPFRVDIGEGHLDFVGQAAVHQGLMQAFIRLSQIHVLAHNADFNPVLGIFDAGAQLFPDLQAGARVQILSVSTRRSSSPSWWNSRGIS